ncbi:MAG TPA: IPT/TIG domain-containing protein [Caulobacteraceae bacterium]
MDVQVTTPVATSVARTLDHFTYTGAAPAPAVSAISPASGSTAGGTSVTITGSNFTGATSVKFGAATATFTVNSATSITATSPAGSTGTVNVTVTTSAGTSATSSADQFTYAAASPPSITSINPTNGLTTGGTFVTITGTNLSAVTGVQFGGVSATFEINSATSVSATAPAEAAGTVDITVTSPGGASATNAGDRFTYTTTPQLPTVSAIAPSSGSINGGTSVTITGTNFDSVQTVKFGSVFAAFSVNSETSITVTAPQASAPGTVDVIVNTSAGTSATTSADQFTYVATAVTAISPNTGSSSGGTVVTVTGTGFTGATAVKFGTAAALSFTVNSDTQITATAPAAALGGVYIEVTTPLGTSADTGAAFYQYVQPSSPPTITAISPSSGQSTGGTTVTITGTDFVLGGTTVQFGGASGKPGTSVVVISTTSLTVTSPSGSGTVDVQVATAAGASAIVAADKFTYASPGAPVVTSIAPTSGPSGGATTVTITGTGFSGASQVLFGAANASYVINSDTQIQALSPSTSVGGPVDITVKTPGGTSATSAADQFTYVLSPPPVITSVGPDSGSTSGGTTVNITGSGFTGVSAVSFGTTPATSFQFTSDGAMKAVAPAGTGVVDIRITTPTGTSAITPADEFAYGESNPAISSISPKTGPSNGGTAVTITGTNFTGLNSVRFGTVAATSFTLNGPTSITAVSPGEAAGTVDITVATQVGGSFTNSADQFTYAQTSSLPAVTAVSPNSGPVSGGVSVTISGSAFSGATSVKFGTAAASFTVNGDTQITATLPAGAVGVVDVTVTTSAGTSVTSAADHFSYASAGDPPAVSSISPTAGSPAGGTTVIISGSALSGATSVKFGTKAATSFTVNTDGQITAISPSGSGTVAVTVTTPLGTSATGFSQFTYQAAPLVSLVNPATGPSAGGTSVTITGTGYIGATQVMFGTTPAASFTVVSASKITAVSPAGTGVVDVLVTTPSGTSAVRVVDHFTYKTSGAIKADGATPDIAPTVNRITPSAGPTSGGTSITIAGSGFTGASAVSFGGVAAASFTVVGPATIRAVSPAGSGTVDVRVTNASGQSAAIAADHFTYTASAGAPVITGVLPTNGPATGGTAVAITGKGFTGATAVRFGGAAAAFSVNSDTSITATSPAGAVGIVDITVTTAAGTSSATAQDQFDFQAGAPTITAVAPASGPTSGGTTVTITGSGFTAVTSSVKFGANAATNVFVDSDTQLTATSPAGAAGTVDVTVTTSLGVTPLTAADKFTYQTGAALPVVSEITPTSGSTAGGVSISIAGLHLSGATAVKFGAVTAPSFEIQSDDGINVTTPPGVVGTVDVTVVTPAGVSATGVSDQYTYIAPPAPTVTAISPASGTTAGGTSVTLTGTNFISVTGVKFGSATATFTVNSATSITATAPAGAAGAVDVTVTTLGGTSAAAAPDQFTYVTPPPLPVINSISPTSGAPGTVVTISGTGFSHVANVFFGSTLAISSQVLNDTTILATAPDGSTGQTVDIILNTSTGGKSVVVPADQFSYVAAAPTVTGLIQPSGPTSGGGTIVIEGAGFVGVTGVKFGNTSATIAYNLSSVNELVVNPPPGTGKVDVTVTNASGTSAKSAADKYTYVPNGAPQVFWLNPSGGPTAGGTAVGIAGKGFTGATAVTFGNVRATSFSVSDDGDIAAVAPAGTLGTVDVLVTNGNGQSGPVSGDQYTYTTLPVVASIAPSGGPAAGGTTVTVTGSHFTGAFLVEFGGVQASSFTLDSDGQLTAVSPAGTGTVDITVRTSGGTSNTVAADRFTYTGGAPGVPAVTAISPTSGSTAGGTSVVITGTNLSGASAVKFGATEAASFIVNSATQITATSPAGSGAVDITVTTSAGSSTTVAGDRFTYTSSGGGSAPVVNNITPVNGPAAGGTTVTVSGTGFAGATQVMFGTVPAASFTVVSATKITAVSPAGTGTVDVLVTTPTGTSAARVVDHFTYRSGAGIKATTLRVRTGFGAAVTVDLTRGRQAVGGKVTLLTPSSAGAAHIVAGAAPDSASLQFTPAPGFSGSVVVSYALDAASPDDAAGAIGDVEIFVDARPDPSADPGVRGVIQAETDASLRFADAQISNFNQHLESLHSDGHGKGGNGVSFNFGFGQDQPNLFAQRDVDSSRIVGDRAWPTPALGPDPLAKQPTPSKYPAHAAAAGPGLGSGSGDSPLTVWTGGAITFGQSDPMTQRPGFRFTTDGLSAGVDARVAEGLTLGAGAGVGQSYAQVDGGSRVDGHDFVGVLYGDWRPVKQAYVDVIGGYGRLDFTSHRAVSPGVTALGDRSGEDPFLSVTAGWIIERDGGFKLTPYARLDEISGRLDAFTEHGAGASDLRYDDQSFNSLQGTLGLRGEWRLPTGYGDWTPRFRFEAHHEFDGTGLAGVNYADDLAGPPFTTQADPMRTDSLSAGVGADLHWQNKTLNLDYTATSDFVRETVHQLNLKLAFKFW